jgi:internalin A
MRPMKKALLVGLLAVVGCDNKYAAMVEAGPDPKASASVMAMASAMASSNPLPPPPKKKEWKCSTTPGVVDFAGDEALEKEVRLKLAKQPGTMISPTELANVKSINLTKYGPVNDLNPCVMPKFTQIHDVFLGQGDLEDLSPLSELTTMMSLRATDNKVKNLDPLKKLVHMDRLDLSHTQVADLSVLSVMTDLTELEIDQTNVTDLKPLEKLTKLEKVTLANTAVKDVSPLKNSHALRVLDISGTQITDYSMLTGKGLKVKMN